MCGGKVVQQDPEADALKAAEQAAIKSNAKTALRRKSQSNTVLAGSDQVNTAKSTLGGG